VLQKEFLQLALAQFELGRDTGFILPESGNLNNYNQVWQSFLSGEANIARTSADFFLQQSIAGLPLEFTVTPGVDRPLTPIAGGWVWAISASDPTKVEFAQALLRNLVAPENLGAWSEASDLLPARRDAFATWTDQGIYHRFLQDELERAGPLPVSTNSVLVTVVGDAVFQVVTGALSSEEAADQAIAALGA
jgi:ABC-type glycerol-3-phosphate transport system substrate-binding protein